MHKLLNSSKGFTLVELLVVLSIIAILSVIGIVSYSGLQMKARDSVRKSYLADLATALEINKDQVSYKPLQSNQISAILPADPRGNAYCIASSVVPDPSFAVPWEGVSPAGFEVVGEGVPTSGAFTSFKVCTYLEQPASGQPNVFCKSGTL